MDTEQVEVLRKGEEILERAHEVAQTIEERARELIQDGGLLAPHGGGRAATDAVQRNSVRPDGGPPSHRAALP